MGYRELIKQVQLRSGLSDEESKDALDHTVEVIAVHLTEGERKDFASQLPEQLQDLALAVRATDKNSKQDILEQFMTNQGVNRAKAKKQLLSSWEALKQAISQGQIRHIQSQLPDKAVALLH